MDFEKTAVLLDNMTHRMAVNGIGGDRGAERHAAMFDDLTRDIADAADIKIEKLRN